MCLDEALQTASFKIERSAIERHKFYSQGLVATVVEEDLTEPTLRTFSSRHHLVQVHLNGFLQKMISVFAQGQANQRAPCIGDIAIIPACARCATISQGNTADFLEFYYPIDSVSPIDFPIRFGVKDRFLFESSRKLFTLAPRSDARGIEARVSLLEVIRLHLEEPYFQPLHRPLALRTNVVRALSEAQRGKLSAHVSQSLHARLTSTQLAALIHLSEFQFVMRFKASFGTTPGRFVLNSRLHEVSRRLLASDEKFAAIAQATGFSNPSHLSNAFLRRFGSTPSQHRKQAMSDHDLSPAIAASPDTDIIGKRPSSVEGNG